MMKIEIRKFFWIVFSALCACNFCLALMTVPGALLPFSAEVIWYPLTSLTYSRPSRHWLVGL